MVEYRKISIKRELADAIERFIKTNPEYEYRSMAPFLEDRARRRLEELEGYIPKKEEAWLRLLHLHHSLN